MLIFKRLLASFIDYLLIVLYAVILFGISSYIFNYQTPYTIPYQGQLIGFITLTLPVFLYFSLSEMQGGQTLGKKSLNIKIQSPGTKNVFFRNLLKFLPWEIAHTGVHWMVYCQRNNYTHPPWVWVLLLLPQVIMLLYIGSILLTKGTSSLYDRWSGTEVVCEV